MKWCIGRQAGLLLKREKEHLLGEDKMKTREGVMERGNEPTKTMGRRGKGDHSSSCSLGERGKYFTSLNACTCSAQIPFQSKRCASSEVNLTHTLN